MLRRAGRLFLKVMAMQLAPDDESQLLHTIRRIPERNQDDAWKYAADRLRPIRSPSVFDVKDVCGELLVRYGGRIKGSKDGTTCQD